MTTRRQALRITAVAGLGLAFGGAVTVGLFRMSDSRRVRATRTQMGMRVTITAVHPDAALARSMVDGAFAEIERLEGILSRHKPGTAVDQLNTAGVIHDAPDELLTVSIGPPHIAGARCSITFITRRNLDNPLLPTVDFAPQPGP